MVEINTPPQSPQNIAERARQTANNTRAEISEQSSQNRPGQNTPQNTPAPTQTVQTPSVSLPAELENQPEAQRIDGRVLSQEQNTIRIQTPAGTVETQIPPNTSIEVGQPVTVEIPPNTQSGDTVTLQFESIQDVPQTQAVISTVQDFPPVAVGDVLLATPAFDTPPTPQQIQQIPLPTQTVETPALAEVEAQTPALNNANTIVQQDTPPQSRQTTPQEANTAIAERVENLTLSNIQNITTDIQIPAFTGPDIIIPLQGDTPPSAPAQPVQHPATTLNTVTLTSSIASSLAALDVEAPTPRPESTQIFRNTAPVQSPPIENFIQITVLETIPPNTAEPEIAQIVQHIQISQAGVSQVETPPIQTPAEGQVTTQETPPQNNQQPLQNVIIQPDNTQQSAQEENTPPLTPQQQPTSTANVQADESAVLPATPLETPQTPNTQNAPSLQESDPDVPQQQAQHPLATPPPQPTPPEQNAPQTTITVAEVLGHTNDGRSFVTIQDQGPAYIHTPTFIPTGSHIIIQTQTLSVDQVQNTPALFSLLPEETQNTLNTQTQIQPQSAINFSSLNLPVLSTEWPALQDSLDALVQTAPSVASAVQNTLPSPTPRLVSTTLFFVAALRLGQVENWLGDKTLNALKDSGKTALIDRLSGDFSRIAGQSTETIAGQWKALTLPMLYDGQVSNIQLFIRGDEDTDKGTEESGTKGEQTRFILDLELSNMGPLQLDGYLTPQTLDIIFRTHHALPTEMRRDMMRLFSDAVEMVNLKGGISFQSQPSDFINVLAEVEKDGFYI